MANENKDSKTQMVALEPQELKRTLRIITAWLALIVIGQWVIRSNAHFIFLLLMAWLIAIAMEPALSYLTRFGIKRGAATGIVLAGLVVLTALMFALFGGIFFTQANELVTTFPNMVASQVDWVNTHFNLNLDPESVITQLNLTPTHLASVAASFAGGVMGLVAAIAGGFFQLMTMFLFAFYIAADGPRIRQIIGSRLSPSYQEIFVTSWDVAVEKTGGFVVSKLVLAAFSSTVHAIFFAAIGLPYWLPMAIITGIVSQFIPTVGTYIGILIPILVAAFQQPTDVIWILIFATIYQQVENYLLSPRISKITMNIHPAIAFGSVILFANLFGAIGALIAIPIAAAILAVIEVYGMRYELIPELEGIEDASAN